MQTLVEVHVLLFARASELAGRRSTKLEMPLGSTVSDARAKLVEQLPDLINLAATSRWAVNKTFVECDYEFDSPTEIAMIPPVSGG